VVLSGMEIHDQVKESCTAMRVLRIFRKPAHVDGRVRIIETRHRVMIERSDISRWGSRIVSEESLPGK
jgi:hypothetical protein